jgi:hypothetical protein
MVVMACGLLASASACADKPDPSAPSDSSAPSELSELSAPSDSSAPSELSELSAPSDSSAPSELSELSELSDSSAPSELSELSDLSAPSDSSAPSDLSELPDCPGGPPDCDTDGVPDELEAAAGTDPLDPASAPAWHPDWAEYPRLVFGPEAIESVRALALAPPYPHDVMLERVVGRASADPGPPKPELFDPAFESGRSSIAKAAAFLALLHEDQDMAAKAFAIVTTLNPHVEEITYDSPFYSFADIHAAETIVHSCQAYDFLRGAGLLTDGELAVMEEAIVELVTALEAECTKGPLSILLSLAQNNHNVKTYAAIGIAGLTFNQRPEAARWVNRGMTELQYYFSDFQATADGGWAEGPGYLNYCLGEALAFFQAYHRHAQGAGALFHNFYDTRENLGTTYSWLSDYAEDPHLHDVFTWPVRIMMPGGLTPNIDDSAAAAMASGYLAAFFDDPLFLWHWLLPSLALNSSAGIELSADIFAMLPTDMAQKPPTFEPDLLLYEAGNAVFRSGFGPADTFLMVMGEHGKIRDHGQGHEHPDASELLFHAGGQYLLLDAGYIKWTDKAAVSKAENHNLILVDGKGPTDTLIDVGSETFLTDFHALPGDKSVVSSTTYEGAGFKRIVVLSLQDVIVVADVILAQQEHDYALLWHGNGGGTSGGAFVASPEGATWTVGQMEMAAVCAATTGTQRSSAEYFHSVSYGQKLSHLALTCQTTAASTAFLTMFSTRSPAGCPTCLPAPPVLVEAGADHLCAEVELAGGNRLIASLVPGADGPVLHETECGQVESASPLVLFHCDNQMELLEAIPYGGSPAL